MRVLALDVGDRRIGVAVSDPTGTLARPLEVIERRSREEDFAAIRDLVTAYDAAKVIVGLPLTLGGQVGPQARYVERYAEALSEALPVPVAMYDERYSTAVAEDVMRQTRKRGQRRSQEAVDAVAAAVILQAYLDGQVMTSPDQDDDGLW